jgi:hypothetical protein
VDTVDEWSRGLIFVPRMGAQDGSLEPARPAVSARGWGMAELGGGTWDEMDGVGIDEGLY